MSQSMSGFSLTTFLLQVGDLAFSQDDFFLGRSVAFLYLTYGILRGSESWGSWIFSSSFETERQPGRTLAKSHSSREARRGPSVKLSSGTVREQLFVVPKRTATPTSPLMRGG